MVMQMAVTRRIGTLSLFLALLFTYGCFPKLIEMEKAERARLKDEGEIQAVHYSGKFLEVDTDSSSNSEDEALVFPLASSQPRLILEDPVLEVKERVVLAMDAALELKSVRLIQEPLVGDDLDQLNAALGNGLAIDFKTIIWNLDHKKLWYVARSRIIRLEDSKILWQGVCDVKNHLSGSWAEHMAAEAALLKKRLNEVAESCAQNLEFQLVGNE
jgi:hypothetical protein